MSSNVAYFDGAYLSVDVAVVKQRERGNELLFYIYLFIFYSARANKLLPLPASMNNIV